jgi:hypothetical protein
MNDHASLLHDVISVLTNPLDPAILLLLAAIAQLVEHATENRRVIGSIPICGTQKPTSDVGFLRSYLRVIYGPAPTHPHLEYGLVCETSMHNPSQFVHFQRLGLKRNPFGSLTQAEEDALLLSIPQIETWANSRTNLQFMGERGRGKTSLLRMVLHRVTQQGQRFAYESLPEGKHFLSIPLNAPLDGIALDEAQRLSWWQRHRLFWQMRGRRLLITTHEDLSVWFRLYGMPYQTVKVAQFITPARVADLLSRRIAYFALDENGVSISLSDEALKWLWDRYGDDVRGTEQALYEVFQRIETPGPISASTLAAILDERLNGQVPG